MLSSRQQHHLQGDQLTFMLLIHKRLLHTTCVYVVCKCAMLVLGTAPCLLAVALAFQWAFGRKTFSLGPQTARDTSPPAERLNCHCPSMRMGCMQPYRLLTEAQTQGSCLLLLNYRSSRPFQLLLKQSRGQPLSLLLKQSRNGLRRMLLKQSASSFVDCLCVICRL